MNKPNIDWGNTSKNAATVSVTDPLDTYYCSHAAAGSHTLRDLAADFADEYVFDADSEPARCKIQNLKTGETLAFVIQLNGVVTYE